MRITGGALKGRVVDCPPGDIRPSMDRMRESVFAALASHYAAGDSGARCFRGLSFLDLFSGSGVIALEAVSRGAAPVDAVEKDRGKAGVLLKNAALADTLAETEKNADKSDEKKHRIRCHFMAAELFVKNTKNRWDLIFCDPPFPYGFHLELLETIAERGILTDRGHVLLHFPAEKKLPAIIGPLSLREKRSYGRSIVGFWRLSAG